MVGQVVLQYLCSGGEKLQERKAIDIRYSVCVFPTRAGEAFQKKVFLSEAQAIFPSQIEAATTHADQSIDLHLLPVFRPRVSNTSTFYYLCPQFIIHMQGFRL